jgi:hypothetical protein
VADRQQRPADGQPSLASADWGSSLVVGNAILGTYAPSEVNLPQSGVEWQDNQTQHSTLSSWTQEGSSLQKSANEVVGGYSQSEWTSTSLSQNQAIRNQTLLVSLTSWQFGNTSTSKVGQQIEGGYSLVTVAADSTSLLQQDVNQTLTIWQTQTESGGNTLHSTGNDVTGEYSLEEQSDESGDL